MVVRLAFAVSVNVDADVIVIDEALSVGDARFQLKCAKAMDRLRESGKTLLFVSHDGGAVKRLCSEALLLERGRLLLRAAPNDTLNVYSKLIADERGAEAVADDIRKVEEKRRTRPADAKAPESAPAPTAGDDRATRLLASEREHGQVTGQEFSYGGELGRIESIVVSDATGAARNTFTTGERARVDMLLAAGDEDLDELIFAMVVKDMRGQEIYGTNTYFQNLPTPPMRAGSRLRVSFDLALNIMPGTYFLSLGWTKFEGTDLRVIHRRYDAITLVVLPADRSIGIANCFAKIALSPA
jgi:hypothetical protein